MIDPKTIDDVKNRMDIVDVVEDFVQLKKAGANYKALSPFTEERTPSFFVSPSKEIFKCFSTGKGGDAISFVMEYDGLSYIEAIKYLAQKYGIEIKEKEQTADALLTQNERESLFLVLGFATDYYKKILVDSDEGKSIGLSYFKERGISLDAIEKFDLGYSLEEWDDLMKEAKKQGYSEKVLENSGLVISNDSKRKYDRFRGRVMFPIHNVSGKVIGFGARTLKKDKKIPKYVNSPESNVYLKSHILYGIHQAKQAIREQDRCYLVEGYTDVISMYMSGMQNVVGSSGTSLTQEQISLIGRFTKNITVLFDGDKAGLAASLRGIDMILEKDLNVRVVMFPEGEDPDSYSRKLGSAGFQSYIADNETDFIRFKAKLLKEESENDPIKRADTIKQIVESIVIIPDPVKRDLYINESSKLLDISEEVLFAEHNKLLIQKRREQSRKAEKATQQQLDQASALAPADEDMVRIGSPQTVKKQEMESMRLLIMYGAHEWEDDKVSEFILSELDEVEFITPIYQEIVNLYKSQISKGGDVSPKYFVHHSPRHLSKEIVNLITQKHFLSKNWEIKQHIFVPNEKDILNTMVKTNILRLKLRIIEQIVENKREELKKAEENNQDISLLLQEIYNCNEAEKQLAESLGNVIS